MRPSHPRPHLLSELKLAKFEPSPGDLFVKRVLFAVLCALCVNGIAFATWLCVLEPLSRVGW